MMHQPPVIPASSGRAPVADLLIVAAVELGGAVVLGVFLLADDPRIIVALLGLMGAGFALLQFRPAIEERIVAAFAPRAGRQRSSARRSCWSIPS